MGTGTQSNPVIINSCANYGTVTCPNCNKGGRAGGIIGLFDQVEDYAWISNCYNTAAIKAYQYVGGIAGGQFSSHVTISGCYNSGLVYGTSSGKVYVGGIAGKNCGPVSSCYNTGDIVSTAATGSIPTRFAGIVGETEGSAATIVNCYSTGQVGQIEGAQVPGTSGNIVGSQSVSPVNCYYLIDTAFSGAGDTGTTIAKTAAELKATGMPDLLGLAFSFDSHNYNDGYPVLAWQNGEAGLPAINSISLSYDETAATVTSSSDQAAAGEIITLTISNLAADKQLQLITISDDYGNPYAVTAVSENEQYTFIMGVYPVTVSVLFENTDIEGDPYVFTIDTAIDPIWTVDVDSAGLTDNTITAGSTVTVTVTRMDKAYSASLEGLILKDAGDAAVDYSTLSTVSGGYNTLKGGVYSFVMPESAVTIGLDVSYSVLEVYVQNGFEGTPSLTRSYDRDDMLAISSSNSVYYTGYDSYPTAVIGKAVQSVSLNVLLADAGLSFGAGDSIILNSVDESYRTYTYDSLYGVSRYYYPNIAAEEDKDAGKTSLDPMLVIKGYQKRFIEFEPGQTIDDMVLTP
jgi:hypothetical protein